MECKKEKRQRLSGLEALASKGINHKIDALGEHRPNALTQSTTPHRPTNGKHNCVRRDIKEKKKNTTKVLNSVQYPATMSNDMGGS